MHAIHPRRERRSAAATLAAGPFPWEEGHAAPEDRAVGIELELIELVHRRELIPSASDPEALVLDQAIEQTLERLGNVVTVLPESA